MAITTSSWLAHSSREPSEIMVQAVKEWAERVGAPVAGSHQQCPVLADVARAAVTAHVDRTMHKRRHRPVLLAADPCEATHHGPRPMSAIVPDDIYAPEPLLLEHTGGRSALAEAINRAIANPNSALVPILSEADMLDDATFHEHHSRELDAEHGGVVLPFVIVQALPTTDPDQREALLRASGWTSYVFECNWTNASFDDHLRLALLVEDVVDEIVQIKADADARVLSAPPLWPVVEIRCTS